MAQYFENDPSLSQEQIQVHYKINDHTFTLTSVPGVFSNRNLDMGSRLLIEQTLKLNITGKVLDLGCGYGPIGLTLYYFNKDISLTLSDINSSACVCARKNAQDLKLNVNVIESNAFEQINEEFDLILFNPPIRAGKQTIYQMFLEAHQHLNEGGRLIIVIRKDQGAISAHEYIQSVFGNGSLLYRKHGYHLYSYTKNKGA